MQLRVDELEQYIHASYIIDRLFSQKEEEKMSTTTQRHADSDKQVARKVIELEMEGIKALLDCIDDTFQKAVDTLYAIEGKVLVSGIGKSGYVASKLATTLASTGTPAFFLHPAEAAHGDLGMLSRTDALILLSNSGNTTELYHIIEYAKRLGVPIIGITRGAKSKLAQASDVAVVLPAAMEASDINAPTTSALMMMSYGDALAVALYEKREFTHEDYKLLHPAGAIGQRLRTLAEVMHTGAELPVVKCDTTFAEAILEISNKRLGCVAVVDNDGNMCGMLTDGDLRRHITLDLHKTTVESVMTPKPKTFKPEQLAAAVLHIMTVQKITNAFVTQDDKPVGVIHLHDLLNMS